MDTAPPDGEKGPLKRPSSHFGTPAEAGAQVSAFSSGGGMDPGLRWDDDRLGDRQFGTQVTARISVNSRGSFCQLSPVFSVV